MLTGMCVCVSSFTKQRQIPVQRLCDAQIITKTRIKCVLEVWQRSAVSVRLQPHSVRRWNAFMRSSLSLPQLCLQLCSATTHSGLGSSAWRQEEGLLHWALTRVPGCLAGPQQTENLHELLAELVDRLLRTDYI